MRKILFSTVAVALLAACADPLADVEKISQVEVVEDDTAREVVASEEEVAREGGLLSGLFRRAPTVANDPVLAASASAEAALAEDAATSDVAPLAVETGEITLAADGPADATITAPEPKRGLFAALRRAAEQREAAEALETADAPAPEADVQGDANAAIIASVLPENAASPEPQTEDVVVASLDPDAAGPALVEPQKRRGLLGALFAPREAAETAVTVTDEAAPEEAVEVASLEPEIQNPAEKMVEPTKRRRLFGPKDDTAKGKTRTGPDARDVFFGDTVPYGEIARVCSAKNEKLGRRVEKFGRSRSYALYDSKPDSTQPRTFYVTGFADGCPRQFTAALALFGEPSMHEQLRYGRPSEKYPYSTTDKAYEKVKSAICGVSKRKPCGAQIKQLEKNTVFISTYERFEDNGRWADILIHDGVVLAAALKDL